MRFFCNVFISQLFFRALPNFLSSLGISLHWQNCCLYHEKYMFHKNIYLFFASKCKVLNSLTICWWCTLSNSGLPCSLHIFHSCSWYATMFQLARQQTTLTVSDTHLNQEASVVVETRETLSVTYRNRLVQ